MPLQYLRVLDLDHFEELLVLKDLLALVGVPPANGIGADAHGVAGGLVVHFAHLVSGHLFGVVGLEEAVDLSTLDAGDLDGLHDLGHTLDARRLGADHDHGGGLTGAREQGLDQHAQAVRAGHGAVAVQRALEPTQGDHLALGGLGAQGCDQSIHSSSRALVTLLLEGLLHLIIAKGVGDQSTQAVKACVPAKPVVEGLGQALLLAENLGEQPAAANTRGAVKQHRTAGDQGLGQSCRFLLAAHQDRAGSTRSLLLLNRSCCCLTLRDRSGQATQENRRLGLFVLNAHQAQSDRQAEWVEDRRNQQHVGLGLGLF